MKMFFGAWAFGTIGFALVAYVMVFILTVGVAFITWSFEPFQSALQEMDWATFRGTICVSTVFGFFFALIDWTTS